MITKTYRIFVIGAGFSRGAGLPLGNELFCEVRKRANIQFGPDNWLVDGQRWILEFWRGGIVGFSLPSHDEYVKQVTYRLVVNYQETDQEVQLLGLKKGNFKMIDFRPDHDSWYHPS